ASIELNFHDRYLKFWDKVNSIALNKKILKATYENCKVLLRSELIKSSSEERSLLKNLGSWIGKFAIGKNQVHQAHEIDPKVLIIEVLEPCQSIVAYQFPNPWTMGILGLLSEICALPNLKMNLKFDIEVATQTHPVGHSQLLSQYTAPLHLAPGVLVHEEKMAPLSISKRLPFGQGFSQQTLSQSSFFVSRSSLIITLYTVV
ncbi:hypothetical protein IFM89_017461, partial [Coptis chinensis]